MSIDSSRPAYRVLALHGFFGPDDHLYLLDDEIYYDGEPNDELEPLNDKARLKMEEYLNKIDNLGREAAAKAGKAYAGRPRNLEGGIELATAVARSTMPIMSAQKNITSIERIDQGPVPEAGSSNPKRGRGRPSKASLSISAA